MEDAAGSLLDHLMDMNNPSEPRMPRVEDLKLLDLMGVISSLCTTRAGRTRQVLGYKTPAAVWAAEQSSVDLPLRLDDAGASLTTPQGQQQQNVIFNDEEEERPSPCERALVVLSPKSTARTPDHTPLLGRTFRWSKL